MFHLRKKSYAVRPTGRLKTIVCRHTVIHLGDNSIDNSGGQIIRSAEHKYITGSTDFCQEIEIFGATIV